MKNFYRVFWIGLLALALCETALAHGWNGSVGYRDSGWTGSVAVYGNSSGYSGYSGALSYGSVYGYAPVIAAPVHGHGPQCYHGSRYGHPGRFHRGHGPGRSHGKVHKYQHRKGRKR
ncbi:MAG: hypothetical protein HKN57_00720 [Xanthomonadales bacterium]|nr:hypothetical protein [Gammaproteobacteria bacterium]MBT8054660.1 hypothetical protein [Gammaproteobacteria bacterium]NND55750.1 hypothetical protein [Xanthomonadales bacterium]NNK50161.1 hypothetical protein [Xanthomonadales bacterium]